MALVDNGNTFECSSYKTLVINFNAPVIPPASGYKVKWRIAGGTWIDVPNQFNVPVTITNVPACFNLEASIQADCGDGNLGTAVIVGVQGTNPVCYEFTFLDNATYSYTPCNNQNGFLQVINLEGEPQTVCAIDGTVTGGRFIRGAQCSI